jgi:hypothetical protein
MVPPASGDDLDSRPIEDGAGDLRSSLAVTTASVGSPVQADERRYRQSTSGGRPEVDSV